MKAGIIFYHKNIFSIYNKRWIEKCVSSILNQTIKDFTIYEINYGPDSISLFEGISDLGHDLFFFNQEMDNHAEAMNFIIDKAFENGEDFVFNTNLDDYYPLDRIEKQLEILERGYDVVSSDFCYVTEAGEDDVITLHKNILQFGSISVNLNSNHNVIAHPAVAMSKKFWAGNRYVPAEIPMEDLLLWKRAVNDGYKFYIHPDELLFYRLHENQITGNNLRNGSNPDTKVLDKNPDKINGSIVGTNLRNVQYNF
jgi:hypothetical protein